MKSTMLKFLNTWHAQPTGHACILRCYDSDKEVSQLFYALIALWEGKWGSLRLVSMAIIVRTNYPIIVKKKTQRYALRIGAALKGYRRPNGMPGGC